MAESVAHRARGQALADGGGVEVWACSSRCWRCLHLGFPSRASSVAAAHLSPIFSPSVADTGVSLAAKNRHLMGLCPLHAEADRESPA